MFFVFKQTTAYEMRISDWSSDVCSSDLVDDGDPGLLRVARVDEHALAHLIFSRRAGRRRGQGHPPQARDMQNDGRLALAIRRTGGDNTVRMLHFARHADPRLAERRSDKQKTPRTCRTSLDAHAPCKCRPAWLTHLGNRKGAAKDKR